MELKARRLTDLLGGGSRRYRQCVLTTFVFDPLAFEALLLPQLRKAGVRNVIVLVDRKQLNELLERMEAGEFAGSSGYTVLPIDTKGVFHPKVMLCVGEKEGLLLVGSGNLTSSGLGGNQEIWASFHRTDKSAETDGIFARGWAYLLARMTGGSPVQQKAISWVSTHAPWLKSLELPEDWTALSTGQQATLPVSPGAPNMFEQLTTAADGQRVQRLTIVSPFFDRDGRALRALIKRLQPKEVVCLVDRNFGGSPEYFAVEDSEARPQVQWKDWNSQVGQDPTEAKTVQRSLHAKLIHLQLEGSELLLFGSANCTEAALGGPEKSARNDEASVLVRRNGSGDYLTDLELTPMTHGSFSVPSSPPVREESPKPDKNKQAFPNQILYVERDGDELHYSLLHQPSSGTCVRAQKDDRLIEIPLNQQQGTTDWSHAGDWQPELVALYANGQRISSYALLSDARRLRQNDPDPVRETLNKKLAAFRDSRGMENLNELLKYLDIYRSFGTADADKASTYRANAGEGHMVSLSSALTPEQLAEMAAKSSISTSNPEHLFSPKQEINSVLREMIRSLATERDQRDDEEQLLLQSNASEEEGEEEIMEAGDPEDDFIPYTTVSALHRYLSQSVRYLDKYNELPDANFSRRWSDGSTMAIADADKEQIFSLTIAFQLLRMYQYRQYVEPPKKTKARESLGAEALRLEDQKEVAPPLTPAIFPRRYGREQGRNDLPDYLFSLIGGLRLLFGRPASKTKGSLTTEVKELYREAAELGIHLTLSVFWSRVNHMNRDLLLLDLLNLLRETQGALPELQQLRQGLDKIKSNGDAVTSYEENFAYFEQVVYPAFGAFFAVDCLATHRRQVKDLDRPAVCYSYAFGFYYLAGHGLTDMLVVKPGLSKQLGKAFKERKFLVAKRGVLVFSGGGLKGAVVKDIN